MNDDIVSLSRGLVAGGEKRFFIVKVKGLVSGIVAEFNETDTERLEREPEHDTDVAYVELIEHWFTFSTGNG